MGNSSDSMLVQVKEENASSVYNTKMEEIDARLLSKVQKLVHITIVYECEAKESWKQSECSLVKIAFGSTPTTEEIRIIRSILVPNLTKIISSHDEEQFTNFLVFQPLSVHEVRDILIKDLGRSRTVFYLGKDFLDSRNGSTCLPGVN